MQILYPYRKLRRRILPFAVSAFIIYCYSSYWTKWDKSSNFYFKKASSKNSIQSTTMANTPIQIHKSPSRLIDIVIEKNSNFLADNKVNSLTYTQRKVIFVITTWRSGSTFFGEVFSSHPAIFYHYEPLIRFGFNELRTGQALEDALTDLENLSECNYEKLKDYMNYVQNESCIFKYNEKIYPGCQYLSDDCYLPNFPSSICKMFPIQLFKILRVKVSDIKHFLQNPNTHILLLLRDPRAIYASRCNVEWCKKAPRCMDMNIQCGIIKEDLASVHELKPQFPGQIHLVRYEDVANEPVKEFKKIFQEIGIPWNKLVQYSIELHTKRAMDDSPWTTFRISQTRVNKWQEDLQPMLANYIQDMCWPIMDNVSYPRIDYR